MDSIIKTELIEVAHNIQKMKINIDCSYDAIRRQKAGKVVAVWELYVDSLNEVEKMLELSL